MSAVIEKPEVLSTTASKSDKLFFHVLLDYRKPARKFSLYEEGAKDSCGLYTALAIIFNRTPEEIYKSISDLAFKGIPAFMQEYLTREDASTALGQATMFLFTTHCICFREQEGYFYIEEIKK